MNTEKRTNAIRRTARNCFAAALGTAVTALGATTAQAHEGDYTPEDTVTNTIPDTARAIIDKSSDGGSTGVIAAGVGVLVLAGIAVAALNMVKGRNHATTLGAEADEKPAGNPGDGA